MTNTETTATSHTERTTGAWSVHHTYSSGTSFWTAECPGCRVVLRSGRHYLVENDALIECLGHNSVYHATDAEAIDVGPGWLWGRRRPC